MNVVWLKAMKLKRAPELHLFLSTYFPDADMESDEQITRDFIAATAPDRLSQVILQVKQLLVGEDFPTEELGSEANRWFADAEDGRVWLRQVLATLEGAEVSSNAVVVKDSNGTVLAEGDSVTVIKDLKVKGGSSDLKRGTMVKKIHLIDDAEAIEARVDGSTLVLKTCFLKKA